MNKPALMRTEEAPAAISREAFPAHPAFPQLNIASDPELMLEVFRNYLKPVSGKTYRIQACTPVRFRWRKDGSRCVLQYALEMVDAGTGRPCQTWVTGVIYAETARQREVWAELRAAEHLRNIPEPLLTFEPLTFIPELQMLVQMFPFDRRLPTLPLIMSGPWPELQQRLCAGLGPGDWQIGNQAVEPIRYRTELGGVVRYTLRAKESLTPLTQIKRLYVKVYHGNQVEQTCQFLQQLSVTKGAAQNGFTVVQPLLYSRERHCLVLEEAPGRSLQEIFLEGEDVPAAARQVARAVAAFSQSGLQPVRRHSPEEQISYLQRAADLVRWARPELTAAVDEIVNQVSARLEVVAVAPIHWDLKTDHIFLDDDRVIFVDLDTASLGDPIRDPAHLLAHITGRIGLSGMPPEGAHAAALAFIEEYFEQAPAGGRERLPVQYAAAMVECAAGIFKRQEPHWAEKVAACVEEARNAL